MNITKVTQVVSSLAAVAALAVSLYVAMQVNIIHVTINSRLSELIELTQKAAKAEGVKEEQDKQK